MSKQSVKGDVYEDDESFKRLNSLRRVYKFCDGQGVGTRQTEIMEQGLDNIFSGITEEEEIETIDIISSYDPIMWYILKEFSHIDEDASPKQILKTFITTLKKHNDLVMKEYRAIIDRQLWGLRLKKEYRQFQTFVSTNIEPDYLFLFMITSPLWFILGLCAFLGLIPVLALCGQRIVDYSMDYLRSSGW